MLLAGVAQAQCRQALALGLDVSGSVDAQEYRLQFDGLAAALQHPEVKASLLSTPQLPVQIAVFEWSAPDHQVVRAPWRAIVSEADIDALATQLRQTKHSAETPPGTALGMAMLTGLALLEERKHCWQRTLDLSGDGKRNIGPHPQAVREQLRTRGVTVNALAIGADSPRFGDDRLIEIAELSSYFRANVILGPNAFVQTALGFEAFEEAMVKKLKRELAGLTLSQIR